MNDFFRGLGAGITFGAIIATVSVVTIKVVDKVMESK